MLLNPSSPAKLARAGRLTLLAWGLAAATSVSACASIDVVRRVDGRLEVGRYIPEEAYAAYALAADAEARGANAEALTLYKQVLELDEESAPVWTRIGAVLCRASAAKHSTDAEEAFERAASLDEEYAPLWSERARCYQAKGDLRAALDAADRALTLDPSRVEVAELSIALREALGDAQGASRARAAGALFYGPSPSHGPPPFRSHAPEEAATNRRRVDDALRLGDTDLAVRLRHRAELTITDLALRAVLLGQPTLAKDLAATQAAADPTDTTALLVLAVASDLTGDDASLSAALSPAPTRPVLAPSSTSTIARMLYAELLARRISTDAARAFLGPLPDVDLDDSAAVALQQRVRERIVPAP